MRQLYYTNYQSGNSGLSNGIMSIECGVIMAFLTKRFLLLDGNVSPPANIVSYDGRVDNSSPSRVTDLIDIPVPWAQPDEQDLIQLASSELTEHNLMDCMFYMPGTVDINSPDALDFSRGRSHWLCETEQLSQIPLLRVSEQPLVPGTDHHRHNLSFYSYLFYLDDETRRAVYQLLTRMQAQKPYAELASRVAADLGDFNAVHMRRGDFKVTYGVTVLDRQPWEAIDTLDHHFGRDQRLLICTDERDDPFFDEIKTAWSDHVFIDHHILDNYASDFAALPKNDSLALAYLSQLVAAESMDFVGTMTSTFTAMIQRLRGNRGKQELFKFLWNELPDPGERQERGRHPVSDCVPLEAGVMIPEFNAAYSWSRFTHLINPAWMREWPESFLTAKALASGALAGAESSTSPVVGDDVKTAEVMAYFEGLRVKIRSAVPGLAFKLSKQLYNEMSGDNSNVIAEIEITFYFGRYSLISQGVTFAEVTDETEISRAIIAHLIPILCSVRKNHSWFNGMVFEQAGKVILLVGDWKLDDATAPIADVLCSSGWELLGDEVIPVRADSCSAIPFARCAWPKNTSAQREHKICKLDAVVYGSRQLHNRGSLFALSPSAAVAELARTSRDFCLDRDKAIKRLCELVEQVPVYQLSYSRTEEAPEALAWLSRSGLR